MNGDFLPASKAVLPALDPGVLFGQGLFETVLFMDGEPVLIKRHLDRLAGSSAALSISLPFSAAELDKMLRETVKRNGLAAGAARITLTAGIEGQHGNLIIHTRPLPYTPDQYKKGFRCGFVSVPRNERSPLAGHKTTNYFENILARREALSLGLDEGLFLNTRGEVAEGTVSNIFFVKDNKVITPEQNCGLLPGIMRRVALETCRRHGIPVEERKVFPGEIEECREVFITNSVMVVMPVVSVDGITIGRGSAGEVAGLLKQCIWKMLV